MSKKGGKTGYSPALRHRMKLEAEQKVAKKKKTGKKAKSVSELLKKEKP